MKVDEKQLLIVGQAVVDGIIVQGTFGANQFTAQDLLDTKRVNMDTIESMYSNISQQLDAAPKKSLRDRQEKSAMTLNLERQSELLVTVYDIRKEALEAAKNARKVRELAQSRLAVLRNIQGEKELETLKSLSTEELNKQIAAAEALVEA